MKMKMIAVMTPLLFAAPSLLSAQSAAAQSQTQARAGTPEARIEAAMQAAARAEVPVSLIESKVAEGRAKRVPEERIAAAVEARASALIRASETLRDARIEAASEGELSVAADALEAGVSQNVLIRISRGASDDRRVVAVAVLADLVRLGHASENAFARVNAALTSSRALANLHAEVAAQLRRGGLNSTLNSTLNAGGVIRP